MMAAPNSPSFSKALPGLSSSFDEANHAPTVGCTIPSSISKTRANQALKRTNGISPHSYVNDCMTQSASLRNSRHNIFSIPSTSARNAASKQAAAMVSNRRETIKFPSEKSIEEQLMAKLRATPTDFGNGYIPSGMANSIIGPSSANVKDVLRTLKSRCRTPIYDSIDSYFERPEEFCPDAGISPRPAAKLTEFNDKLQPPSQRHSSGLICQTNEMEPSSPGNLSEALGELVAKCQRHDPNGLRANSDYYSFTISSLQNNKATPLKFSKYATKPGEKETANIRNDIKVKEDQKPLIQERKNDSTEKVETTEDNNPLPKKHPLVLPQSFITEQIERERRYNFWKEMADKQHRQPAKATCGNTPIASDGCENPGVLDENALSELDQLSFDAVQLLCVKKRTNNVSCRDLNGSLGLATEQTRISAADSAYHSTTNEFHDEPLSKDSDPQVDALLKEAGLNDEERRKLIALISDVEEEDESADSSGKRKLTLTPSAGLARPNATKGSSVENQRPLSLSSTISNFSTQSTSSAASGAQSRRSSMLGQFPAAAGESDKNRFEKSFRHAAVENSYKDPSPSSSSSFEDQLSFSQNSNDQSWSTSTATLKPATSAMHEPSVGKESTPVFDATTNETSSKLKFHENAVSLSHAKKQKLLAENSLSYSDRILIEILETECAYVNDLYSVIEGYLGFFMQNRESLFISPVEVCDLFGNIEEIFEFNRTLYFSLDKCELELPKVAQCFVENAQGFDVYTEYCTGYPKMVKTLAKLLQNSRICDAIKDRQLMLKHGLPLDAYLLKPVQRILKYHLFLQNLLNHCESSEQTAILQTALKCMTSIAQHINEVKKRNEHFIRAQEIERALYAWTKHKGNLIQYGDLLLEGSFPIAGTKNPRHLFLFEEVLLITKDKPDGSLLCKDFIMCYNLMLIESVMGEPLAFHVLPFDNPRNQYTVTARTLEQKREWTKELKRLIMEHFNAEIPLHAKEIVMQMGNELFEKEEEAILAERLQQQQQDASALAGSGATTKKGRRGQQQQSYPLPKYLEKRRKSNVELSTLIGKMQSRTVSNKKCMRSTSSGDIFLRQNELSSASFAFGAQKEKDESRRLENFFHYRRLSLEDKMKQHNNKTQNFPQLSAEASLEIDSSKPSTSSQADSCVVVNGQSTQRNERTKSEDLSVASKIQKLGECEDAEKESDLSLLTSSLHEGASQAGSKHSFLQRSSKHQPLQTSSIWYTSPDSSSATADPIYDTLREDSTIAPMPNNRANMAVEVGLSALRKTSNEPLLSVSSKLQNSGNCRNNTIDVTRVRKSEAHPVQRQNKPDTVSNNSSAGCNKNSSFKYFELIYAPKHRKPIASSSDGDTASKPHDELLAELQEFASSSNDTLPSSMRTEQSLITNEAESINSPKKKAFASGIFKANAENEDRRDPLSSKHSISVGSYLRFRSVDEPETSGIRRRSLRSNRTLSIYANEDSLDESSGSCSTGKTQSSEAIKSKHIAADESDSSTANFSTTSRTRQTILRNGSRLRPEMATKSRLAVAQSNDALERLSGLISSVTTTTRINTGHRPIPASKPSNQKTEMDSAGTKRIVRDSKKVSSKPENNSSAAHQARSGVHTILKHAAERTAAADMNKINGISRSVESCKSQEQRSKLPFASKLNIPPPFSADSEDSSSDEQDSPPIPGFTNGREELSFEQAMERYLEAHLDPDLFLPSTESGTEK